MHHRVQQIWRSSLPLRVVVYLALGLLILTVFWRYGRDEHDDTLGYVDIARKVAGGERLYSEILYWKEIGYWHGSPEAQPFGHGAYVYPPPLALLLVPLLALPDRAIAQIWYVVECLALLVTAWMLARLLHGPGLLAFLTVALLLVLFQPIRRNLWLGQADVLTLAFVTLALGAFVARHDARAGLAVAGAVAIKPFVGFVVLYLIWKRAYRAAAIAVVLSAVFVGGSLLLLGPQTVLDYIEGMSYWTSPQSTAATVNQAASGMLIRAFTSLNGPARIAVLPWLVLPARMVLTLATVGLLAYVVSRERALAAPRLVTEYGLLLVAMVFISPYGEDLHFVFCVIGLLASAVLMYQDRDQNQAARLTGAGVVAVYLIFLLPLYPWIVWDAYFYLLCAMLLVVALAVIVDTRCQARSSREAPGSITSAAA
jgi:hypothetical protein